MTKPIFDPITIKTRSGQEVIIREAIIQDAPELQRTIKTCAEESEFKKNYIKISDTEYADNIIMSLTIK